MIHTDDCNEKNKNKVQCKFCANKFEAGGINKHITVRHNKEIEKIRKDNEENRIRTNPQDYLTVGLPFGVPSELAYLYWEQWSKEDLMGAKMHTGTPQEICGPEIIDTFVGGCQETARWIGNPMELPPGKSGEEFIRGQVKLIKLTTDEDILAIVAMNMLHPFNVLMLQIPVAGSTKKKMN